MSTVTTNEIEVGCHVTAFAAPDPSAGPPGDLLFDRDAANADDFLPESGQPITTNEIEVDRHVTALATPDPATEPPGDIGLDRDAANTDDFRPESGQRIGAALARIERAIFGVVHAVRDGLARRQTVRELRLLGRSRLADLGIEPDRIEHAADAMTTARRSRPSARGTGLRRPRSG